ncbi:MAG: DUF5003 domain-containing protein [Alistipes sp.]|uniref:DUF5003 domain-containing protein n=1 Tax=Alistipes sp. TaxID=1872444 RepID=UPI0025C0D4A3|nr:DUF5003 domain-containing protein [Alistipes sp.]MCD8276120.1 DUF5003 domain-containing protein [Alistipes sp.]
MKDRFKLTVGELPEETESRNAMVMIFPKAVYDEIKSDLEGNIIDSEVNDIKSAYSTYIMANLTQEKKSDEPAGGVSFTGYYYMSYDGEAMLMTFAEVIGQGAGFEPKMENISDTPEGDAIYSDYGLSVMPEKNIWKATVPATMMSDENNRLGITASGISDSDVLTQAYDVTGIKGEEISGQTSGGQTLQVWSAYLTDGGKPSGYQIMVMDTKSETIKGICVVKITD